jgi:hypothetical protein
MVLPGVISTFTGELDAGQRLIAGQLWAGPKAQVAGLTAVRWHAIGEVPDDGVVRLLVDSGPGTVRSGFAVRRRTTRLDPVPWHRGPLQICSRVRALVDGARELREADAARHLLVSAVQRRHVREADLLAELEAGAIRGSKVTRQALRDVATGAWSVPEADVLGELARSTLLPRVWPNPVLRAVADNTLLPSPDFWIDDVALAGQVHSRQYHSRTSTGKARSRRTPSSVSTASRCSPLPLLASHAILVAFAVGLSVLTRLRSGAVQGHWCAWCREALASSISDCERSFAGWVAARRAAVPSVL